MAPVRLCSRASLSASAGFACAATARGRSACPIRANAEFLAELRAALVSVAGLLPSGPPASPPRAETRPCKRPLRCASHGVSAMHAEPAPPLMAFFLLCLSAASPGMAGAAGQALAGLPHAFRGAQKKASFSGKTDLLLEYLGLLNRR